MIADSPDDVLKAALALPEAERLRISQELLLSVPPPGVLREGDPGFFEELDRRSEALRSGEDPGIDAFEALNQIEQELRQERSP